MEKTIVIHLFLFLSFSVSLVHAQDQSKFFSDADAFFTKYVSNGNVVYKAIYDNPKELQKLVEKLKTFEISKSQPKAYKAFWINAYNLSVIKGIIDNYPIQSPLDKKGFFDKTTYTLAGENITLNDVENKKLRAVYNDARFHFVLVCGAKGCPPIISKAYKPSTLEKQLERQTKKAINNPDFIKIYKDKVVLSEIFKWYKEDFVKNGKNEINFLNRYLDTKIAPTTPISYYTYDWRLNSK